MLRAIALALVLAGAPARPDAAVPLAAAPHVTISLVGTNDLHGHIEALPRLAGYLANLRRARARDGGGVVLVDAGDMFQGTLESNLGEGAAVVRAYNLLGYDAAAVGNHEFDYGPVGPAPSPRSPADDARGALKARAAEARVPAPRRQPGRGRVGRPAVVAERPPHDHRPGGRASRSASSA